MSRCTHCHGTGQAFQRSPVPYPAARTHDPRRMIPHGNEVMGVLRAGTLQHEVHLYCGTCPRTKKDRWALAAERIAKCGAGTAMVLPEGGDASNFRFPPVDVGPLRVSLATFAYGLDQEQQHALGHALIAAGLKSVAVLGGPGGPLRFEAV
ncbi:MAG: hypothetical protein J0I96_09730 [Rhodanobacter sp.]|nr:hypothetical protein [Rhodanobacter sp.]